MKRFLPIFLILTISVTVCAAPVSQEKARAVAEKFLASKGVCKSVKSRIVANGMAKAPGKQVQQAPTYYVFDASDAKSFVIIAGDDIFPEIAGYSDNGAFPSDETMPEAMKAYLAAYSEYVEAVRDGSIEAPAPYIMNTTYPVEVQPIVSAAWGQDAPYNTLCPDNVPAGCVATAIAQIMYSHKWPLTGKGGGSTSYNGNTLTVNFNESSYRWADMKDKTVDNNHDQTAAAAVAKISYDCGVAVQMKYASGGSGAYIRNAVKAFYTNFSYKASTLRCRQRACVPDKNEWIDLLKAELSEGRPVYYSGASSIGGGKDAAGHAFVIDGYDTHDLVHVNWGWDGIANGYYDIAVLNPTGTGYAFTDEQGMITGIIPDTDNNTGTYIIHPYLEGQLSTETTSVAYPAGSNATVTVTTPESYNISATSISYTVGIGLYDSNGTFLEKIQPGNMSKTYDSMRGYGPLTYVCTIPAGYPDGEYILKMYFQKGAAYIEPDVVGGSVNNYIRAVIADGMITFDNSPVTAINRVTNDGTLSEATFDILGRKAEATSHGIILHRQAGKTKKIMNRLAR